MFSSLIQSCLNYTFALLPFFQSSKVFIKQVWLSITTKQIERKSAIIHYSYMTWSANGEKIILTASS